MSDTNKTVMTNHTKGAKVHYFTMPCNTKSAWGVNKTSDLKRVDCKLCIRLTTDKD